MQLALKDLRSLVAVAPRSLVDSACSRWATFAIWLQAHYLFVCRVAMKGLCPAAAPPRSLVEPAGSRRAVGSRSNRLLELFLYLVLPARLLGWRRRNNTALEIDTRLKLSYFVTSSGIQCRRAADFTKSPKTDKDFSFIRCGCYLHHTHGAFGSLGGYPTGQHE